MPYRDPEKRKVYHRQHELERYHRRRADAIRRLGGKCAKCPETRDLQFDHIDPKTKSFDVSEMWSLSISKFEAELKKCQLLCEECHNEKTRIENTGPREHGTHAMHRRGGCRCSVCRAFFAAYQREYRARKRSC